jgi:hypothetical protein
MQDFQSARDDVTEVSEGRVIAFLGLAFLLVFSIVPFDHIFQDMSSAISSAYDYIRVVAATGAPPLKASLF